MSRAPVVPVADAGQPELRGAGVPVLLDASLPSQVEPGAPLARLDGARVPPPGISRVAIGVGVAPRVRELDELDELRAPRAPRVRLARSRGPPRRG